MRVKHIQTFLATLLTSSSLCALKAQDSASQYSYVFKIRAGLTAGDLQKTHFDNKVLGFGAEARCEILGNGSAVAAELTWEYVPGRDHDVYPWASNPLDLDPVHSYDNRKEYGQGFSLRCAYFSPFTVNIFPALLPELNFEWFAGLGLDRYKVRTQVEYLLNFTPNRYPPLVGEYDGDTFGEENAQLVPGFFAGLKYRINKDIGLELSLRNFGMYHYGFIPGGYSGHTTGRESGKVETGTSRGWALEFAIAAKL